MMDCYMLLLEQILSFKGELHFSRALFTKQVNRKLQKPFRFITSAEKCPCVLVYLNYESPCCRSQIV